MFQLTNLTAAGNQNVNAVLADGSSAQLTFIYRPAIQRWTVDVVYGSYVNKGYGLACGWNVLRKWRQDIPFGLQVMTTDETDPFMASDLDCSNEQTPRVLVSILDETDGNTDVSDVETNNYGAVAPPAGTAA